MLENLKKIPPSIKKKNQPTVTTCKATFHCILCTIKAKKSEISFIYHVFLICPDPDPKQIFPEPIKEKVSDLTGSGFTTLISRYPYRT